jgi:hypothetical protein
VQQHPWAQAQGGLVWSYFDAVNGRRYRMKLSNGFRKVWTMITSVFYFKQLDKEQKSCTFEAQMHMIALATKLGEKKGSTFGSWFVRCTSTGSTVGSTRRTGVVSG